MSTVKGPELVDDVDYSWEVKANDRDFHETKKKKWFLCFKRNNYKNNRIKTSKYNVLTFIPLNLFEQYHKAHVVFFTCLLVLQSIPYISTYPWFIIVLPLMCIILVRALRDLIDDIARHRSDTLINNKPCKILTEQRLPLCLCPGSTSKMAPGLQDISFQGNPWALHLGFVIGGREALFPVQDGARHEGAVCSPCGPLQFTAAAPVCFSTRQGLLEPTRRCQWCCEMASPVSGPPCSEEEDDDPGRKARGRPRLPDTDRVRRRLESRKKYDGRRVYLGEAHGAWVWRREKGGGGEPWSDARLAAYLLALERRGKPCDSIQRTEKNKKGQKQCENSLESLVAWYQDHKNQCPLEPDLSELDTNHIMCPIAVWQCQAGHRFFQDLRCSLISVKHRGCDDGASSDDSSSSTAPVEQIHEICPQPSHVVDSFYTATSESPSEVKGQGSVDAEEDTVVCVPMQMESGTEEFFEGVDQDELGHVVTAGCNSQVIIIAGPGYEALAAEGIQLDVTADSSGDEVTCATLEAVSTYTQTEPEDKEWEHRSAGAVTEDESFYTLQREQETEADVQKPESDIHLSDDTSQGQVESVNVEEQDYSTELGQLGRKDPEKRRSKHSRVLDADGLLEMFHCPFEGCPQVYTALSSFQNHVNLVHRKGKTKVCPEPGCGKRFYLSNHLRRHMIIHTGVREFICETCGKSFKRKNHLEVHRRTHTGETPLQCEVCGYQCRQRASLNWHMKKHRADIQFSFSCEYCGKLFEKRDSVKFHILKSHPEEYNT